MIPISIEIVQYYIDYNSLQILNINYLLEICLFAQKTFSLFYLTMESKEALLIYLYIPDQYLKLAIYFHNSLSHFEHFLNLLLYC